MSTFFKRRLLLLAAWVVLGCVIAPPPSQGQCIGVGDIVGVGISKSDDHVYFWYSNGWVSSGTTDNPVRYRKFYRSNQASEKTIAAVDIASGGAVYYFYTDGTVSSGTTDNPVRHRNYYRMRGLDKILLAAAIPPKVGGDNFLMQFWYSDATMSEGTSDNPYRLGFKPSNLPPNKTLIDAAFAKDFDHVYYWFSDGTVSSGSYDNPTKYRPFYPFHVPC